MLRGFSFVAFLQRMGIVVISAAVQILRFRLVEFFIRLLPVGDNSVSLILGAGSDRHFLFITVHLAENLLIGENHVSRRREEIVADPVHKQIGHDSNKRQGDDDYPTFEVTEHVQENVSKLSIENEGKTCGIKYQHTAVIEDQRKNCDENRQLIPVFKFNENLVVHNVHNCGECHCGVEPMVLRQSILRNEIVQTLIVYKLNKSYYLRIKCQNRPELHVKLT